MERVDAASSLLYKGYRYPVEIISYCVWLYHRFPLSFREVEEMMMERGMIVSYETIRAWCRTFGSDLRERAASPSAPARWDFRRVGVGRG
jgi:putative transposase